MTIPEPGFYYHYKHDPEGPYTAYAYEVIGVSRHTEDQTYAVLYRPLYKNTFLDVNYSARPLDMFMETVSKDGKEMPRFLKITDSTLVARLMMVRDSMYPSTS